MTYRNFEIIKHKRRIYAEVITILISVLGLFILRFPFFGKFDLNSKDIVESYSGYDLILGNSEFMYPSFLVMGLVLFFGLAMISSAIIFASDIISLFDYANNHHETKLNNEYKKPEPGQIAVSIFGIVFALIVLCGGAIYLCSHTFMEDTTRYTYQFMFSATLSGVLVAAIIAVDIFTIVVPYISLLREKKPVEKKDVSEDLKEKDSEEKPKE